MKHTEIDSEIKMKEIMELQTEIDFVAFQNIDIKAWESVASNKKYSNCIFLGCNIPSAVSEKFDASCLVFPQIDMPYNPFINKLYSRHTLLDYKLGNPDSYNSTLDKIVYNHYIETGKEAHDILETLARRMHDHSITNALNDFLEDYDERKLVAVMGGHGLLRNDNEYLKIAIMSKRLTEMGYLMITGGGPGAMEATHVGAYMAGREEKELIMVIELLSQAPQFSHKLWFEKAFEALSMFPDSESKSLGIPTWLYGHEPPTPFASHIAKYFANSVREDGLLSIAKGGIIFTPGSAGTVQEIFQEVTQNHYLIFGYASPMVFFNHDYWTKEMPIYPLMEKLSSTGNFKNLILSICDDTEVVIKEMKKFTDKQ